MRVALLFPRQSLTISELTTRRPVAMVVLVCPEWHFCPGCYSSMKFEMDTFHCWVNCRFNELKYMASEKKYFWTKKSNLSFLIAFRQICISFSGSPFKETLFHRSHHFCISLCQPKNYHQLKKVVILQNKTLVYLNVDHI